MVPTWVLNSPKACAECYIPQRPGGKKKKITDLTSSFIIPFMEFNEKIQEKKNHCF
jgi:hypothetical protein